jgi:hypothetical protein
MGYLVVALRHAYSLTTAGALVRAATVAVAYAVLLLAAFLSLIAPVIFAS